MKKTASVILLSMLVLLASCSSMGPVVSSGPDEPIWYPNGRNVSDAACFVAHASALNRNAARDAAYNDLLSQVSEYLGYDVVGRYYRELGEYGSVSQISLEIDSTSTSTYEGYVHYYILAYADTAVIASMRSPQRQRQVEMEAQVESLRLQAMEHYRNNRDVDAIRCLMEAIAIAGEYGIASEGNSADELLERALYWLGNIRIRLSGEDPETGSVTVRVVRDRGLLSPPVVGAPVEASFTVHTHLDGHETFSVPFMTGSNGRFGFEKYHPQMAGEGRVVFSLDLEEWIDEVEDRAGLSYAAPLGNLAQSIVASFDYSLSGVLGNSSVLVIMDEFDENGNILDSTWARDAFISYLEGEGIEPDVASTADQNFSSAIGDLVSAYSQYDWIFWSAAGLADVPVQPDGYTVYVVEGYTMLLNTRTLEIVNLDDITRAVSWGEVRDECLERAFSIYGSTVAANMTPYF